MAKKRRVVLGNVVNSREGNGKYIKVNLNPNKDGKSVTIKSGQYINIEPLQAKLDGLPEAVESGRLSEELAEKIQERIEKDMSFGAIAEAYIVVEE